MKKKKLLTLSLASIILLQSCNPGPTIVEKGTVNQGSVNIFAEQKNGKVGDCMPYYDEETGKMCVYYIHEAYTMQTGFHDFWLFETDNFYQYEDKGSHLPYVNDVTSQDMALGTGSVMRDNEGLYHYFYTGWNGTGNMGPLHREKIQHATSIDRKSWTKIPEDGFYGDSDDFRDPFVTWVEEDQCYWMLVSTRNNVTGYLRWYKSKDLKTWTDHGSFYNNDVSGHMMECPQLFKFGDYWYLTFSEMTEMVTSYRYCTDIMNPEWIHAPEFYQFDGKGSYAGKSAIKDGRIFLYSWIGIKKGGVDNQPYGWAGNMVCHELVQQENGELKAIVPHEITDFLNHQVSYDYRIPKLDKTTTYENDEINFVKDEEYRYVKFDELSTNSTKLTFDLTFNSLDGYAGLSFGLEDGEIENGIIAFDTYNNRISYQYGKEQDLKVLSPQAHLKYKFEAGKTYPVTVIIENECAVVYLNNERAFSSRMYCMPKTKFSFFALDSDVKISNIKFFE